MSLCVSNSLSPLHPLVTLLIATRNRSDALLDTVKQIKAQSYRPIELIIIDDASDSNSNIEPMIRREWPDAIVFQNNHKKGYIACRSFGMKQARGAYICSLDDDSCFTNPRDLERAIERIQREADIGIITFSIHHAPEFSPARRPPAAERYIHSFIGCGNIIRSSVVKQIGGYRDFYEYYAEEAEYSLRALAAGWKILFFPSVWIHHRVSPIGRSGTNILRYSCRNNLRTLVLHMPLRRLVFEGGWRIATYAWESIRMLDPAAFCWALFSFTRSLPGILQERVVISKQDLRLYDSLRFRVIKTRVELDTVTPLSWRELFAWFRTVWLSRHRAPRRLFSRQPKSKVDMDATRNEVGL